MLRVRDGSWGYLLRLLLDWLIWRCGRGHLWLRRNGQLVGVETLYCVHVLDDVFVCIFKTPRAGVGLATIVAGDRQPPIVQLGYEISQIVNAASNVLGYVKWVRNAVVR